MPLEKPVDFLREFRADAFRRGDLFDRRFAEPIHGTKFSQEQILAVLTDARAIVQNTFADAFFHQELVIGIRETVRFIADALQQPQRS
jgi:hypothetical protein